MPTITRYFIKAAMLYFGAGLLTGFLISARSLFNLPAALTAMTPTYLHMLVVGWITQLIIGVAYWMFPKFSKESPRGDERVGWVIFILLNIGLVLRIIGEPLNIGWMLPLSAILQFFAVWLFIIVVWPRVKER
jgi:cbb3-type cytochrome oxidase subunit 1